MRLHRLCSLTVSLVLLVRLAPQAHAFLVPEGGEFHVNSYTTDYQIQPDVCGNDDGSFVVVWSSYGADGDGFGVFGQRFDSNGAADGTEFQVTSTSAGTQFLPRMCCNDDGFVVVWTFQEDADQGGIFARRFDSAGLPVGTDFQVNSYTTGGQYYASICCNDAGDFVVVWKDDDGRDGDGDGIFGRRLDSTATPVGTEFHVNTYTTDDQEHPVVSCDAAGNFVVAWDSWPDIFDSNVFAQRFDAGANKQGGEIAVNTYTSDRQRAPSVCHDGSGDFVVAWSSRGNQAPSSLDIVVKRFDSTGAVKEPEFAVSDINYPAGYADLACGTSGDFQVVWSAGAAIDLYELETRARRYDSSGNALGPEFAVNTEKDFYQDSPAIAGAGSDGFVVVWRSTYQEDGSDYGGIYAQRLRVTATTTTTLPFGGQALVESGEFQINTYTPFDQVGQPGRAVARATDGDFLVTWESRRQEGGAAVDGTVVMARLYEPDGTPVTSEFVVNTYTTKDQDQPAVAARGNDFVVVWNGYGGVAVDTAGVFGRLVDGEGQLVGSDEFLVNTYTTGGQGLPDVAGSPDGSFVVVWEGDDLSSAGLFGQLFDSTGTPVGAEFQINDYTTGDQRQASIARRPTGEFVVVWRDGSGRDGSSAGVFGRRFDSAGSPVAPDFQVNSYTTYGQSFPSVDYDGAGNFVVVYDGGYDDSGGALLGRRFDSTGAPVGTEFQVNSFTPGFQTIADVAVDLDGRFMVVWQTDYLDFDDRAIAARLFDSTGAPFGEDFQVNTYTTDDQYGSQSVATDGEGNFTIVWQSRTQDGANKGMFGRVFCRDLDGDKNCDRVICKRSGLPDDQDIAIKPKLVLAKINTDTTPDNDKLTFKGELELPLSTSFDNLDPGAEGARLALVAADGTTRTDDTVPAGAAWSLNGAGNRWSYKDKTGSVNGIIKYQIKDRRKKGPNQVQVIVKGKNGSYPVVGGDEPVQAVAIFGDLSAGLAFECGETVFEAADCKLNGARNKLTCKR